MMFGIFEDPSGWLNDEIMNKFTGEVVAHADNVVSLPSGLFDQHLIETIDPTSPQVRVSQAKCDTTMNKSVTTAIFVISRSKHWIAVVADLASFTLTVLDSLPSLDSTTGEPVVSSNVRFLVMRAAEVYLPAPPPDSEPWQVRPVASARQANSDDCGIHAIASVIHAVVYGLCAPLPGAVPARLWRVVLLALAKGEPLWPLVRQAFLDLFSDQHLPGIQPPTLPPKINTTTTTTTMKASTTTGYISSRAAMLDSIKELVRATSRTDQLAREALEAKIKTTDALQQDLTCINDVVCHLVARGSGQPAILAKRAAALDKDITDRQTVVGTIKAFAVKTPDCNSAVQMLENDIAPIRGLRKELQSRVKRIEHFASVVQKVDMTTVFGNLQAFKAACESDLEALADMPIPSVLL